MRFTHAGHYVLSSFFVYIRTLGSWGTCTWARILRELCRPAVCRLCSAPSSTLHAGHHVLKSCVVFIRTLGAWRESAGGFTRTRNNLSSNPHTYRLCDALPLQGLTRSRFEPFFRVHSHVRCLRGVKVVKNPT